MRSRTVHSLVMDDHPPESVALRDARVIAERIARDEAAADEARLLYQTDGLPILADDAEFAAVSRTGELLHAVREHALLERTVVGGPRLITGSGRVYLTSSRLLHVGTETTEAQLNEVYEVGVALERLLLVSLNDETNLAIEIDRPRLLRVQVEVALEAALEASRERAGA